MKKKSLILTTAFAMALGVGVAVGAHQSKAGVKEVGAATETRVYYAIPSEAVGSYTVKLNINRQGDGDNWAQYDMSRDGTKTQGGKLLYVAEYTDLYNGVGVMQFQLYDGETWKSQEQPISSWTFATEYNGKVYVYGSGWADYNPDTEPVPEVKYYYSLNGAEDVEMLPHNASEVKSAELSFKAGDKLTFKKAAESYTVNPKDDAAETTVELVDDELVFVQDYNGALYLDISGATGKLWAGNFAEGYYLNGSFSGWNIKHAAKASEQSEDPGTFEVIDIELADNAEVKFFHKVDDTKASAININSDKLLIGEGVDAEIEGEYGNLKFNTGGHFDLYLNTEDSNYLSVEKHGEPEPVDPDVPEHDGYYIVGSKSEWKYSGATELTGGEDEQNYAKLLNYTVSVGESFKVRSHLSGVDTWFSINGAEGDEGNYSSETEKAVDIFASKDGKLYVFDHSEPVQAPKYYYSLNGAADVEMTPNGETEVMSASLSFKAGDELTFKVSESPYEEKTTYAAEPKEDVQYTNVELVENKLVFAQDYSGSLYLNIEGETGKLWAGHLEGYYLVGTHCGWNVKHGIKAPEKAGEAGTFVLAGVELAENAKVKFYHFGDHVYEDLSQGYVEINPEKLKIAEGIAAALDGGDLKFNAAGCFDIYLNTNDDNYLSVEKNGYTPADLDDFLTKFDNDLSVVCNTLGSDDYLIKLKGEWSRQSSAFKLLSATDQKTIHDAGFDYEGDGKLGTMIAKYRYIVNKYGTAEFNDFIWNQDVVVVGNSMPELSTDSNVMLIVIITISAVSVASLGALLILKKKKRK